MSEHQPIEVTSHVARDFLQNAAYFTTMPKLVWEYVANSLDNAKDGEMAVVAAQLTSHEVIISDNGCGMSETDARMSFERHATSKIAEQADLFNIRTLGFRGEALASIAAVAQVMLKTRQEEEPRLPR